MFEVGKIYKAAKNVLRIDNSEYTCIKRTANRVVFKDSFDNSTFSRKIQIGDREWVKLDDCLYIEA